MWNRWMEAPRLKAIQTPPPDRTMWLTLQEGLLWTWNLCGETDGQPFYPVWSRASRLREPAWVTSNTRKKLSHLR